MSTELYYIPDPDRNPDHSLNHWVYYLRKPSRTTAITTTSTIPVQPLRGA